MSNIKIFDPTTSVEEKKIEFVPRPKSLRGLRIGLVDNRKYNSDKLLIKIADILEKEYHAEAHIILKKHNAGVPAHREIIDEIASGCDVVIAGVGD